MDDNVQDDEILYRRVIFDDQCYEFDKETGNLRLTQTAFSDPKNQPSVDRAKLCSDDPTWTQGADRRNGVVSLLAAEIRSIDTIALQTVPPVYYRIDVVAVPEKENPAHAEIRAAPEISSTKVFRRLRISLAILATRRGWLIRPYGYRD
jgi:hypothetical protein